MKLPRLAHVGLAVQPGDMAVAHVAWCLVALASSSTCLKQPHALLGESSALLCPKVFHSGGRARMCCLFDQLHCLNKSISGSRQCWLMALVVVVSPQIHAGTFLTN